MEYLSSNFLSKLLHGHPDIITDYMKGNWNIRDSNDENSHPHENTAKKFRNKLKTKSQEILSNEKVQSDLLKIIADTARQKKLGPIIINTPNINFDLLSHQILLATRELEYDTNFPRVVNLPLIKYIESMLTTRGLRNNQLFSTLTRNSQRQKLIYLRILFQLINKMRSMYQGVGRKYFHI